MGIFIWLEGNHGDPVSHAVASAFSLSALPQEEGVVRSEVIL